MQSYSCDQSLSGLSMTSTSSNLGYLAQQTGSMIQGSKIDRRVTLGMMLVTSDATSPLDTILPKSIHRSTSTTSSTDSLESIDDEWEEAFLYTDSTTTNQQHPIGEVMILQKEVPSFAVVANNKNVWWMDHVAAFVGTLLVCFVLYLSSQSEM